MQLAVNRRSLDEEAAGGAVAVDEIPSTGGEILSDRVLGRELSCSCGRLHRVHTRRVVIEPGVGKLVPQILAELVPVERILLVADRRTWHAAGDAIREALESRYSVRCCTLEDGPDGHLHASVELVDELAADIEDLFDVYVAVGSGTVNDITKELAHRRGRPYVVVATAASMNGFTSSIVALLEKGLKTTGPATPPVAVFADPTVLAAAPRELTLAGLGDLVSKPYSGCDWAIAALVRGEFHCPLPDRLLSGPFERALDVFPRLADGDPEAVVILFELLLVSGISMAVAGTSSPASGGEHLLSHFWDMMRLRDRRPLELHGAQVGVASMVVDRLFEEVVECDFCIAQSAATPSLESAEREVREIFGDIAPAVWPQWRAKLEASSERDLERLCAHQDEIKDRIAATLDQGVRVRRALQAAGAPLQASQLGISGEELASALRHGRKIRSRYTVLDVAAELAILDDFADRTSIGH
jgi:glycerol-1-phosphate dehydrogenase [NAD(P)+]